MTNNIEVLRGLRKEAFNSDEPLRVAAIDAALAAMGGQGEGVCHWRQQDESGDWFSTGCGHEFVLNDARQYADGDAPFPFCAYCAKPMRFYRWRDESPCTCDNGDGPECEGCTDNRRCSAISAPQQPEAQAGGAVAAVFLHRPNDLNRGHLCWTEEGAEMRFADGTRFYTTPPAKVPEGWKLVPVEPTPEIIARAAAAIWPTASAADIELARKAAPIVLMSYDLSADYTVDELAAVLATMAPAYRAMLAAAPAPKEGV